MKKLLVFLALLSLGFFYSTAEPTYVFPAVLSLVAFSAACVHDLGFERRVRKQLREDTAKQQWTVLP